MKQKNIIKIKRLSFTILCCSVLLFAMAVLTTGKQPNAVSAYASEDGVTDFVSRLYTVILNRTPDEDGLATWTGVLLDGSYTGVDVAAGFITSDEFFNKEISNEEFVQIMYQAFFGREADPTGLATWVEMLDDGYRKSYIFTGFANSTEFGALCESYGIEAGKVEVTVSEQQPNLSEEEYNIWMFVERLYTEVLERTPDMSGIRDWVTLLQNGTWTGAEVSSGFIMSEEFQAKDMSNEEYVQIMYKAFFGREADEEGLGTWVTALENGYTKEFVFAGFADSVEFGVLCDKYGIIQGEIGNPEVTPTPTPGITETPAECFEWRVKEDGTVEITGLLDSSITELVIPAKIEEMDVTSIGDSAFRYCRSLVAIRFPDSVTTIEDSAFEYCSSLETIKFPNSMTKIGEAAFMECSNLSGIEIPGGLTCIESYAFGCTNLTSIEIPDNITSIEKYAFASCYKLTSIEIPNSVTSIGKYAFDYCTSLTSIKIPDSVTSIGNGAFRNCENLVNVELPEGLTSIEDHMFWGCRSLITIEIPNGVTSIGSGAFFGCEGFISIEIPSGVTSIEKSAFEYCSSLTYIELPDNVTYVGDAAFAFCSSLTGMELPKSVTSIENEMFRGCKSLISIEIPDGVTSIGRSVFEGCASLTEIGIPDSMIYIYADAFKGCMSLEEIEIPDSVTSITDSAFEGCTNLTNIVFNGNNKIYYFENNALYERLLDAGEQYGIRLFHVFGRETTEFCVGAEVTHLSGYAFDGLENLQAITLEMEAETKGYKSVDGVLYWVSSDGSKSIVKIPEGYPNSVFEILEGVEVGYGDFTGCKNITKIVLNNSMTSFSNDIFSAENLEEIYVPETVTEGMEYYNYYTGYGEKWEKVTIITTSGSYAEQFAIENGIKVEIVE